MAELIALYELLLNQISALDERQRHQRERIEDQERAEAIALDNIRLEHAEKFVELTERLKTLYTLNNNIYHKKGLLDFFKLFSTVFKINTALIFHQNRLNMMVFQEPTPLCYMI